MLLIFKNLSHPQAGLTVNFDQVSAITIINILAENCLVVKIASGNLTLHKMELKADINSLIELRDRITEAWTNGDDILRIEV